MLVFWAKLFLKFRYSCLAEINGNIICQSKSHQTTDTTDNQKHNRGIISVGFLCISRKSEYCKQGVKLLLKHVMPSQQPWFSIR